MPFQTSQNDGMTAAANALARIFVGDPQADAAWRKDQISNETEMARQRLIAEQTITEGVQRKAQEAAAAANYAQAAKYKMEMDRQKQQNDAFKNLGDIFTQMPAQATAVPELAGRRMELGAVPSVENGMTLQTEAQDYMPQVYDQAVPNILANLFTGDIDPKMLTAANALPGLTDQQIARNLAGAGKTLGKDEYVSLDDRNANRRFDVGAGSRLVGGDGQMVVDLAPAFTGNLNSQADLRKAQTNYYNKRTAGGGAGGKVPKMSNDDLNASISTLARSLGIQPVVVKGMKGASYNTGFYNALGNNPQIQMDLMNLANDVHSRSGGNAAAVNQALMMYMRSLTQGGQPLQNFRSIPTDLQLPTVEQILGQLGFGEEIPTNLPGSGEDLPNLQNVGNDGMGMDGMTATNPQTGEKVIFKNGQWEPM